MDGFPSLLVSNSLFPRIAALKRFGDVALSSALFNFLVGVRVRLGGWTETSTEYPYKDLEPDWCGWEDAAVWSLEKS